MLGSPSTVTAGDAAAAQDAPALPELAVLKSSLAVVPELPILGDAIDTRYYPVGTLANGSRLVHGEPDAPLLAGTIPGFDGEEGWTWTQFAAAHPELAAITIPHEWSGEPTAANLDLALFPLALPPVLPE
jgi:hypothetical protein